MRADVFAATKRVCIHFYRNRILNLQPTLLLTQFLGLVSTRMYSSPVVCTRLLTSRHSYVLVSCRMYSSPDL